MTDTQELALDSIVTASDLEREWAGVIAERGAARMQELRRAIEPHWLCQNWVRAMMRQYVEHGVVTEAQAQTVWQRIYDSRAAQFAVENGLPL